jgi:hypothetical protein
VTHSIFGTADEIILFKDRELARLVDYKFGYGAIEPADINPQSLAYAIGLIQLYKWVNIVEIYFVCPRRNETLSHTFTRAEIEGLRARIKLILERATAEEKQYNPNTEACRFCGNRLTCPALAEKLLPIAKKYADKVDEFEVSLLDKMDPALIDDPETIAKMKVVGMVMDRWVSAVNSRAIELATDEGWEIPGFELRYRAPVAKIDDAQAAFEAVSDLLTPEQFMDACKVSMTNIAKAYAEKLPRGEKKEARPAVETRLLRNGVIQSDDDSEDSRTPYLTKKKT